MNDAQLIGAVEAVAAIKGGGERIQGEVKKTITELTFRLAGKVKEKLTD